MFSKLKSFKQNSLWLPVLAGLLHYAAFPPLSLWPLAFISLVPLFLFLRAQQKWWRMLLGAFIYCLIYAGFAVYFVLDPILIGGGSLIWLLIFGTSTLLLKRFIKSSTLFFFLLPIPLTVAEYIAGNLSLLPAYLIMSGIPLAGTPFMLVALFGGLAAASFFVALVNAAASEASFRYLAGDSRKSAAAVFIFLALLVGGLCTHFLAPKQKPLPLRVMSVAMGDHFDLSVKKYDDSAFARTPAGRAQIEAMIQALLAPIGEEVDAEHPGLVIFPEEMIDMRLPGVADAKAEAQIGVTNSGPLLEEYAAFATVHRVSLLATMVTFDVSGKKYISTVEINPDGSFGGIYEKRFLTIVTEYWPFGEWLPFYWKWELAILPPGVEKESFIADNPTGPYSPGALSQKPFTVNGVNIGTLICLEGHYPYLYSGWRAQGAQLILYDGSNVWLELGRNSYRSFEMKIHQLQAVETDVPIIVSGAGEIPALVSPDGTVQYSPMGLPGLYSYTEGTF